MSDIVCSPKKKTASVGHAKGLLSRVPDIQDSDGEEEYIEEVVSSEEEYEEEVVEIEEEEEEDDSDLDSTDDLEEDVNNAIQLLKVDDNAIRPDYGSDSEFEELPPPIEIPDALKPPHLRTGKDDAKKKKKSRFDDSDSDDDSSEMDTDLDDDSTFNKAVALTAAATKKKTATPPPKAAYLYSSTDDDDDLSDSSEISDDSDVAPNRASGYATSSAATPAPAKEESSADDDDDDDDDDSDEEEDEEDTKESVAPAGQVVKQEPEESEEDETQGVGEEQGHVEPLSPRPDRVRGFSVVQNSNTSVSPPAVVSQTEKQTPEPAKATPPTTTRQWKSSASFRPKVPEKKPEEAQPQPSNNTSSFARKWRTTRSETLEKEKEKEQEAESKVETASPSKQEEENKPAPRKWKSSRDQALEREKQKQLQEEAKKQEAASPRNLVDEKEDGEEPSSLSRKASGGVDTSSREATHQASVEKDGKVEEAVPTRTMERTPSRRWQPPPKAAESPAVEEKNPPITATRKWKPPTTAKVEKQEPEQPKKRVWKGSAYRARAKKDEDEKEQEPSSATTNDKNKNSPDDDTPSGEPPSLRPGGVRGMSYSASPAYDKAKYAPGVQDDRANTTNERAPAKKEPGFEKEHKSKSTGSGSTTTTSSGGCRIVRKKIPPPIDKKPPVVVEEPDKSASANGEKNIGWEKPAWAKGASLRKTDKGDKLKSGKYLSKPIGGIKGMDED